LHSFLMAITKIKNYWLILIQQKAFQEFNISRIGNKNNAGFYSAVFMK